jgi:hypothetical protein
MNRNALHMRLNTISIFCLLLVWQQGYGQSQSIQSDDIPRQRLLSHQEFATHLDTPFNRPTLTHQNILFNFLHHLHNRTSPVYFFSKSDRKVRVEQFAAAYPDTVKAMKRDADEFMERFGVDVDWILTGKDRRGIPHTPNTVRALARQRYAESIVLQYHFQNDESYAAYWLNHVRDFANDVEAGMVEKGGNDIFERFYAGHRLRRWLANHHLLDGEPAYTPEDRLLVIKSLILNAANIYDQCRKFSYGNHQLVGAVGVYEATTMFPEFPVLRQWKSQVKKIILEHFEKEISAGGFQFERSSHYHKLDIVNYLRFYRLAVLNNDPVPERFAEQFKKMFSSMTVLALPNKHLPLLQDVSDSVNVQFDAIADEMSAGALLFTEPQFKSYGRAKFPASYYWFFSLDEIERYAAMTPVAPHVHSARIEGSDYIVMRDGVDPKSNYLLIDAGIARQKPDHTHGGVLGIIAMSHGLLFLPNYPVRYSDPQYIHLKNSYAKSVAIADSLPQARGWIGNAARTGFGKWSFIPTPVITAWITTPEYDFVSASHNGFDSIGVAYSRSVFFKKGKYWVVVDDFQSAGIHTYQQIWQGSYTLDQQRGRAVQGNGEAGVLIQQIDQNISMRNTDVSGYYPSLWCEVSGVRNYRFITLLYPMSVGSDPAPWLSRSSQKNGIEVTIGGETDSIVFEKDRIVFRPFHSIGKRR